MQMKPQKRYVELDWLRVILILAVFLHHVGMPFNGDDFVIMNVQSSKILDDIMVYFEQFRLPLLFLIAGAGSVLYLNGRSAGAFIHRRLMRLLIPLIVAMLLVIPPQNYIAQITNYESYWQAWPTLVIQWDSKHLWFIEYLLIFAVLSLPIYRFLLTTAGQRTLNGLARLSAKPYGLSLIALILLSLTVSLKSSFSPEATLVKLSCYAFFYIMGMLLISHPPLWRDLRHHRSSHLNALIASSVVFYGYYFSPDLGPYLSLPVRWGIWWAVSSLVAWTATLTLLGYAQRYFTQPSRWLTLANTFIYPFYIFHQTVIVVVGYFIIQWPIGLSAKVIALLLIAFLLTFGLCAGLVYPFNRVRWLFGVQNKSGS